MDNFYEPQKISRLSGRNLKNAVTFHKSFRFSTNFFIFCLIILSLFFTQTGCKAQGNNAKSPPVTTSPGEPAPASRIYEVLIVKSHGSLNFFGWKGEMELKGAEAALYRLGIDYAFVEETELKSGELPCKILLLANTRCMTAESLEGIRKFVKKGGKLFATYMSAYRDENNMLPLKKNNFLISDVYGIDFNQWVQAPSRCEFIFPADSKKPIALGRNQAMLVKPENKTETLAIWLNWDNTAEKVGGNAAAAVTFNPQYNTIYCGEDLFAPENSESSQVLEYIGILLEKLEPGIVKKKGNKKSAIQPSFNIPDQVTEAVKPAGESIFVGTGKKITSTGLLCRGEMNLSSDDKLYAVKINPSGETYMKEAIVLPVKAGEMLRLDTISVYGKEPYINIYSPKKKLIARCFSTLKVRNVESSFPVKLINMKSNGTYSFMAYRGELLFTPQSSGGSKLVNKLSMDEYLSGVVPKEMPSIYPEEALKAMAVVARTFAESSRNKHKSESFDLCDSVHCQVYEGVMGERLSTDKAVAGTSGEMIYYGGKPAPTTFHSTCGGYEADSSSVWGNSDPVLAAGFDGAGNWKADLSDEKEFKKFIDDPPLCYCSKSGRFRWERKFTKDGLKQLLDRSIGPLNGRVAYDIGKLYSISITKRASDGRVQSLEVVTSSGTYNIEKDKIRWIISDGKIGTGGLSSTLFYITSDASGYTFTGGGWGHGVGMCQEGARGMAEMGMKYSEIIKHYYQGVELRNR